jgi:hypothetical protein
MFLSYIRMYDEKIGVSSYKIVDSDFIDEYRSPEDEATAASSAVIKVYEKRNLNVAANLVLLFQYQHNAHGAKISHLIKWNKEHTIAYVKYADEVEKYMVWI